jgi:hypothetical protein
MSTHPIVIFGRSAITIKDDITSIIAIDQQPFVNLNDLASGIYVDKPYATYEPDYWLLDGNFKFAPSANAHPGYISLEQAPSTSTFVITPVLTITFNSVHSTTGGLTLHFSTLADEYADNISILYYDSVGALIRNDTYTPTGKDFSTNQAVSNFKQIKIGFTSMHKAYRYARLLSIDFDSAVTFSGANIKAARLIEDINPLSIELTVNTLDLTLFSSAGAFSITNPTGIYANLQYKEPLDVYESIDGLLVYLGRFYLDEWNSESENLAAFRASDGVGLLERGTYIGGLFQAPTISVGDLVSAIMSAADVDYVIDASLTTPKVDGLIELYSNCRDALQQVCFYVGAYVTCARSKVINILPLPVPPGATGNDHALTSAQKGIASPLTLKPLVTGVEIHQWAYDSDNAPTGEILYSATLGTGNHTAILGKGAKLAAGLTLGGTATYSITVNRYLYATINVTVAGTVILSQNEGLTITETYVGEYNPSVPAGSQENVVIIDKATLMTTASVTDTIATVTIAERVYDYYQQRYLQKTKLFASLMVVGNSVLVNVQSNKQLSGIVEKMTTDLSGGFVSDVEIVGVIV